MIKLGDQAKDKISGFKGTVVCITEWIHGCRRIGIQPNKLNSDGEPINVKEFDEPQTELITKGKPKKKSSSGGPRPKLQGKMSPSLDRVCREEKR